MIDKEKKYLTFDEQAELEITLIKNIKQNEDLLRKLQADGIRWTYGEDAVYRFYHHSFKTYRINDWSRQVLELFKELLEVPFNKMFLKIIEGTVDKKFEHSYNQNWYDETKPVIDAFLHIRHLLDMMIKYGIDSTEQQRNGIPGWFTVLYIYNIR